MSRNGSISFEWAEAERFFRLDIGKLRDLQEHPKVDAGPEWVLNRLESGAWFPDDVREIIRGGLMGGGLSRDNALKLVDRYVVEGAWMVNVKAAKMILLAALIGAPDEAPKKEHGEAEMTPALSPEESGASLSSMATAL